MRRMGLVNFLHRTAATCVYLAQSMHKIAKDGYSRQDVPGYLFEHARMSVREWASHSWEFP